MPTPPSKSRDETNIGHGGPGLGQQFKSISSLGCCAVASLLCGVMLLGSWSVHAQATPAADDAAKRIEALRDQAKDGVADTLADTPAIADSSAADESGQADTTSGEPLPANESLLLGDGEGDLFSGTADQADAGSLGDGWLLSTLASLGVVLAIVFGIRWVLKRGGVVTPSVSSGSVVEVLSRTTVAPRSHVVLLRVGQRILVVSDSSAGMRTLASVHDAEEVAELLGAVDSAKSTSMSQNFGSVMKKLSGQWSGEEAEFEDDPVLEADGGDTTVDPAQGALSRVRGRLAALSDSGGRA